MQIVTAREFRANQKRYFEMAEREPIFIRRRGAAPISITTVREEDLLSASDLQSIKRGLDDIKAGRVHRMKIGESLDDLLARTGHV